MIKQAMKNYFLLWRRAKANRDYEAEQDYRRNFKQLKSMYPKVWKEINPYRAT